MNRLAGLMSDPRNVMMACQVANHLVNTGDVEVTHNANVKCLPVMLEYLLPLDFKEKRIVNAPKNV